MTKTGFGSGREFLESSRGTTDVESVGTDVNSGGESLSEEDSSDESHLYNDPTNVSPSTIRRSSLQMTFAQTMWNVLGLGNTVTSPYTWRYRMIIELMNVWIRRHALFYATFGMTGSVEIAMRPITFFYKLKGTRGDHSLSCVSDGFNYDTLKPNCGGIVIEYSERDNTKQITPTSVQNLKEVALYIKSQKALVQNIMKLVASIDERSVEKTKNDKKMGNKIREIAFEKILMADTILWAMQSIGNNPLTDVRSLFVKIVSRIFGDTRAGQVLVNYTKYLRSTL